MSQEAAVLTVTVRGVDVNASDLMTKLQAEMRKTDAVGDQLAAQFGGKVGGALRRTADDALRTAQAEARLAQAMGQPARAAQILTQALNENSAASQRSIASVQAQVAKLQGGATAFQQFGDAAKSSLLGILGPAALVGTAIGALSQLDDLTKLGAQAEQTAARFDQAARAAGTTGEAYTAALRAASAGTISDLNLQLAANRARLLGVGDSAAQLAPLLAIARDRAQEMGISTTQAFNDLVTGLGRGSALILDNLGITVSVTEANKAYADQIGKSVSALTEQEQKTALINAVLAQSAASMATTGGAIDSNSAKIERLNANLDNLKAKAGIALAGLTGGAADGAVRLTSLNEQVAQVAGLALSGATSFEQYGNRVAFANTELSKTVGLLKFFGIQTPAVQALTQEQFNYAQSLIASGVAADVAAERARNMVADVSATGTAAAAAATQQAIAAQEAALASQNLGASFGVQAQATTQAMAATAAHTAELQASTEASLADAAAKDADAAQTALLTAQTQAAIDAFLALNPNLTASGAAAAAGAAGFPPLIQRLIEATLRAQEARNALAQFNALAGVKALRAPGSAGGGPTGEDEIRADRRRAIAEDRRARVAAGTAAAEAEARYQEQLGNSAPLLERRRAELAQLTEGSAAYFDKLSEINKLEAQAVKKPRGGGGGGGGATKLSDQQRLNNSLLADQEKYQDKAEAAATEHEQRLLDIEREFQEKSLAQQRQNETGKRDSRASFYRTLLLDTEGIAPDVQQSLSAAYETAFAKSQELAQAGNAKLAADYLALKNEQLSAEAQYQADLAKAREDGDKDLVARLERIHALEAQAAAEREKQLLASGDADVAARDKALSEEEARYAEQTGKIGTAADQLTERKILAAERAGKAIDAENLKLERQEQLLNRIGGAAPGTAPTGPQPTGAPAATPAPVATPESGGIAAALEGVIGAVNAMKDAVTREQSNTTSAVKGLGSRLVN